MVEFSAMRATERHMQRKENNMLQQQQSVAAHLRNLQNTKIKIVQTKGMLQET